MSNKITTAVVLAAGQSSRFYPYNGSGHKSLVTLCGKTLIVRTLESLKKAGVHSIVIVEGIDEAISKNLTPEDTKGLAVTFVIQEKSTGMGDALLSAAKYLQKSFFVLSPYHFEFADFAQDMLSAQKTDEEIVLLTKEDKESGEFGVITKKGGKIQVSEKTQNGLQTRIVSVYILNRKFIEILHSEKKDNYNFENALTSYSKKHETVLVKADKETLSLKYPWDLLEMKNNLLNGIKHKISNLATVSKKATIKGNVFVSDGAVIMDGAVIYGPAYIGRKAYIGTGAILRSGVCIEENVVVGAHMEIKNSILMRGATTHSGFIGDSVIGEKSKIAAGFHTGNVRLDRKEISAVVKNEKVNTHQKQLGVFIGSNTSIGIKVGVMPGILIGNNSVIGPGTTVMENIEDNVTYYTEFKRTVKKKNLTQQVES